MIILLEVILCDTESGDASFLLMICHDCGIGFFNTSYFFIFTRTGKGHELGTCHKQWNPEYLSSKLGDRQFSVHEVLLIRFLFFIPDQN